MHIPDCLAEFCCSAKLRILVWSFEVAFESLCLKNIVDTQAFYGKGSPLVFLTSIFTRLSLDVQLLSTCEDNKTMNVGSLRSLFLFFFLFEYIAFVSIHPDIQSQQGASSMSEDHALQIVCRILVWH